MKVILIANNLLSTSCYFEDEDSIEIKKKLRPLSIKGEELAKKLSKLECLSDVEKIYSDASSSSISSAKYLAESKDMDIYVNKKLYDCKVGNLNGKTVKMLSYFQEHDFKFKLDGGESLQDCGMRISYVMSKIVKDGLDNVVVFLPKRCIMAYLINHADTEFNLDERLIITYNGEIILGNDDEDIDIFEIEFKESKLEDIRRVHAI